MKLRACAPEKVRDMAAPVRCGRCLGVYDLGVVTVTARYADCSVWQTPCCGAVVDDRVWTARPSYTRLDQDGFVVARDGSS